jgi:hypothetical protein
MGQASNQRSKHDWDTKPEWLVCLVLVQEMVEVVLVESVVRQESA